MGVSFPKSSFAPRKCAHSWRQAASPGASKARRAAYPTDFLAAFLIASLALLLNTAASEDVIALRNLEILRSPSVVSFDEDGIVLDAERPSGSKLVTWDEVESLELADKSKQAAAEKLLHEIGEPLFRITIRLTTGDDEGLLEPAEKLYPVFAQRHSPAAYRVFQALMWGRIAAGHREEAVEPWLLAYDTLRMKAAKLSDLPGKRRPLLNAASGLSFELEPVWFDTEAAKLALPKVETVVAQLSSPPPDVAILYAASLALVAGDTDKAREWLDFEAASPLGKSLRTILQAETEVLGKARGPAVMQLEKDVSKVSKELQPLALYWLGRSQLASEESHLRDAGLLELMRIPAIYGKTSPELAAAALSHAADVYQDDKALADRLKAEIRRGFPGTWHAAVQRRASSRPSR